VNAIREFIEIVSPAKPLEVPVHDEDLEPEKGPTPADQSKKEKDILGDLDKD